VRVALIAIVFIAGYPAIAPAQSLGDCKCDDVREMRDRWCSARAAREEYARIAAYFKAEQQKTGKTQMYSTSVKNRINQGCVQEAINSASDRGAVKATATTEENSPIEAMTKDDCRIVVTRSDSACLKQVVEAHEGVHREACLFRTDFVHANYGNVLTQLDIANALALNYLGDTKNVMTAADFAFEESVSYGMEMQLLAAKWQELQKRCVAKAFEAELDNSNTAGEDLWNNAQVVRDANGNEHRMYKMYDLSKDPCPSRPPPPKSECTLR
jgi:hypothetical protein